jgi:hypothetical protein
MSTGRLNGRTAVLGTLATVVLLQLLLAAVIDLRYPKFFDAEFFDRLTLLRRRRAEHPDRPLALIIGSSRPAGSFRPEILPPLHDDRGREVLVFNDSHIGGDPILMLMDYQRLRRAGIHPDYLVIEVFPAGLTKDRPSLPLASMNSRDARTLHRYFSWWDIGWNFLRPRMNVWHNRRSRILHELMPIVPVPDDEGSLLGALGGSTPGPHLLASSPPETIRLCTEGSRLAYGPRLADFKLADNPVRAFNEILHHARNDGTRTVLLVTPESGAFRSWYSEHAKESLARFLEAKQAQFGSPVVDAQRWLPDDEFIDGHHVLLPGADHFTRLLAERVLEPLVQGRIASSAADR